MKEYTPLRLLLISTCLKSHVSHKEFLIAYYHFVFFVSLWDI